MGKKIILFASGDVGGARAIIPLIDYAYRNSFEAYVVNNGYIANDGYNPKYKYINIVTADKECDPDIYIFSSSLKDILPLSMARHFKSKHVKTIHVLDNWCNYSNRLEIDGFPRFEPDYYTVMDEIAYNDALAYGIKKTSLEITGYTSYASYCLDNNIKDVEFGKTRLNNKYSLDTKKLLFVSEPVSLDQPQSDTDSYRGYTEKDVLIIIIKTLELFSGDIELLIAPHPREKNENLIKVLSNNKATYNVNLLENSKMSDTLHFVDGVIGMASVALYESWLLGLPTISIQPNLLKKDLASFHKRPKIFFVQDKNEIEDALRAFMSEVNKGIRTPQYEIINNNNKSIEKIFELFD